MLEKKSLSKYPPVSSHLLSETISQHSWTHITNKIQSNAPPKSISISSENFQNIQGREIEVFPKKLEKVDKPPRNLIKSSRIYYPFHFLSKTIKMIPKVTTM